MAKVSKTVDVLGYQYGNVSDNPTGKIMYAKFQGHCKAFRSHELQLVMAFPNRNGLIQTVKYCMQMPRKVQNEAYFGINALTREEQGPKNR